MTVSGAADGPASDASIAGTAAIRRAAEAAETTDPSTVEFSDDDLALRFTSVHRDRYRYVAAWSKWLKWDGVRWADDRTLIVYEAARAICRGVAVEMAGQAKASPAVVSAKTVAAVEKLARADRAHAATVEQWDADPWLLNTPAGIVDLRTGRMRRARPDDYMTRCTAVAPGRGSPTWIAFLDRVTAGDAELQRFLQRVAGYALTGSTREHALFFLYGTGGNGKGTFINTLTGILERYGAVASIDTFTASSNDRHPTDLAMLRGARLVSSQETEEGRRWAESRIKAMTGGDPITARFMRQDFFTFDPHFKLVIAGNHKPGLRNVDEALRRRMHLIPFTQTIDEEERDVRLPERLREEWPGILQWMIDGCGEWQRIGLQPPASVMDATEEYFGAEDTLGAWIEGRCRVGSQYSAPKAALYECWKLWAEDAGERPGSMKRFTQNLEGRGFVSKRLGNKNTPTFMGLCLNV